MILMVDNYDSFTYNLVQMLAGAGAEVEVLRNDAESVEAMLARRPEGIVLSPGPGPARGRRRLRRAAPPAAAGAPPRRLPRPPGARRRLRRHWSTARRG